MKTGGKVICVIADCLKDKPLKENVLYLSEGGFDEPFSAQRAISRNRVIHALTDRTFVAQSSLHTGGTWDGTSKNLRHRWSNVYCFADGSEASVQLQKMGAEGIAETQLENLENLPRQDQGFFED